MQNYENKLYSAHSTDHIISDCVIHELPFLAYGTEWRGLDFGLFYVILRGMDKERRKLYLFGAAGFAAEAALIAIDTGRYDVAAFIEADDAWMPERSALEVKPGLWVPVIPQSQFAAAMPKDAAAAIAIADPGIAKRLATTFAGALEFPDIIHPSADVRTALLSGRGNICYPGTIISWHARIGSFNKFQAYVTIGHETTVGDFNEFNPRATVSGCVDIGSGCLFGAGCTVRQGLTVADGATIAMGAAVVKNVEPGTTVAGVPAKPLR